ncbi:MAG: hypothetical protein M1833_001829 [Piccolia ochrophora]|nr:MAG: hypothetical protein M1833_001829 [Piccolia ochrophora]
MAWGQSFSLLAPCLLLAQNGLVNGLAYPQDAPAVVATSVVPAATSSGSATGGAIPAPPINALAPGWASPKEVDYSRNWRVNVWGNNLQVAFNDAPDNYERITGEDGVVIPGKVVDATKRNVSAVIDFSWDFAGTPKLSKGVFFQPRSIKCSLWIKEISTSSQTKTPEQVAEIIKKALEDPAKKKFVCSDLPSVVQRHSDVPGGQRNESRPELEKLGLTMEATLAEWKSLSEFIIDLKLKRTGNGGDLEQTGQFKLTPTTEGLDCGPNGNRYFARHRDGLTVPKIETCDLRTPLEVPHSPEGESVVAADSETTNTEQPKPGENQPEYRPNVSKR